MDDLRRILLLSTSTLFRGGYLDYAEGEICGFLGNIRRVLFVPSRFTITLLILRGWENGSRDWVAALTRYTKRRTCSSR